MFVFLKTDLKIIKRSEWTKDYITSSPRVSNKQIVVNDIALVQPCDSIDECRDQLENLGLGSSRYNFILAGDDLIFECRGFERYDYRYDGKLA